MHVAIAIRSEANSTTSQLLPEIKICKSWAAVMASASWCVVDALMTSVTARQKYRNYRGDTKRQTSEKKGSRKVKRWRKTNQNPGAWIGYRVQELVSKENKNENKWAQKVESLVFWCRREWNQGPHKQLMLMPPNPSHSGRQHVRRLQHARKNLNNKTITYIYIYIYTHIYYIYIYIYMYISHAVSTVGVLVVFFLYGCLLPQISLLCGRKLFAQAAVPTSLVDGGVWGLHIYVHTCEGVAPISRYVDAYMCFESSDNS